MILGENDGFSVCRKEFSASTNRKTILMKNHGRFLIKVACNENSESSFVLKL